MRTQFFCWPARVYYEDTDSGGVVYHANYLKYMERARTEWLRQLGLSQSRLLQQEHLIFAVRSLSMDYIRPARFDQQLEVRSRLLRLGKVSLEFEQHIYRIEDNFPDVLLTQAEVKIASLGVDPANLAIQGPKKLPPHIYELMRENSKHLKRV